MSPLQSPFGKEGIEASGASEFIDMLERSGMTRLEVFSAWVDAARRGECTAEEFPSFLAAIGLTKPEVQAVMQRLTHFAEIGRTHDGAGHKVETDSMWDQFAIGDNLLLRRLGKGALSDVWHVLSFSRPTPEGGKQFRLHKKVLKIAGRRVLGLHSQSEDHEKITKQFRRDALVMKTLYPGRARAWEVKEYKSHLGKRHHLGSFFAMEMPYRDGGSGLDVCERLMKMADPVKRRELTILVALEMLRQTDMLHRKGFVHRDLKPGNFLGHSRPDEGPDSATLHMTDFDTAIRIDEDQKEDVYAPDQAVGTAAYASPEQIANKPGNDGKHSVGPASDVYNLGCSFYELATGTYPFGTGKGALLRHMIQKVPSPPEKVRDVIGEQFFRTIEKMLDKEAAKRISVRDAGEEIWATLGKDLYGCKSFTEYCEKFDSVANDEKSFPVIPGLLQERGAADQVAAKLGDAADVIRNEQRGVARIIFGTNGQHSS